MPIFKHDRESESSQQMKRNLKAWYKSRLGRRLLRFERHYLNEVLPNLFGYHLLQVGSPVDEILFASTRINHHVVLCPEALSSPLPVSGIAAEASFLPVMTDCIDVVLLPHVLEFEEDPHQTLREVGRILIAEGHVVVLGFNPWGLWGLWRVIPKFFWSARPPACRHAISQRRLSDWLSLLGFDVVESHSYFFRPPFQHAWIMRRLKFMELFGRRWWPILGSGYMLVAKKRETTLTPLKPHWRSRRKLLGRPSMVEPAPRIMKRNRKE